MKKRQATCLVPLIPYFTVLAMFHFDDSSPVKPFGRFYLAIKTGMKEEDVMKAMEREFPSGGKYPRPFVLRQLDGNYLGFILDPHNWRYNAEIVAVHFRDGHVMAKDYSAD